MDLFSPIAYISIGGSKYCLIIVDDYSRFTWVLFLQEKSQTQETLKRFLRRAQNEFGLRIKKIRSDNGTEFKNSQMEGFLEEEGIKNEFSSTYTPQQNGVVEIKNRTLLDMARTMLDEYKWKSPRGGEEAKTEIYKLKAQLQAGISVRNKIESEREGENKSTKEIERMTLWFVLPRFGSKEPILRCGGHKDQVSFNPFPLSNGHLDPSELSP
jgi:transposase InsO family protein